MRASRVHEPPFAVRFFDEEFRHRISAGETALNPREALALPYLRGSVLDLGCGLGSLALEAARRGCTVTAVDASRVAVARLRREARRGGLRVQVVAADAAEFRIEGPYDGVVSINLLMFFRRERATALLRDLRAAVAPGGVAAVSTLAEGTTYLEMFDPREHCLFRKDELAEAFRGWSIEESRTDEVPAPHGTTKVFSTLIARRRGA